MRNSLLSLLLLFSVSVSAQNWISNFSPDQYDENDKYLGGTEIMSLTPHKGKLYAASSYVCDLNNTDYNIANGTPIIVLDSSKARWKEDVLFPDCILVPSLKEIIFTKDYLGNTISPDTLLVTGPNNKYNHIFIYVRDDQTGNWIKDSVTTVSGRVEIRSIGTHYDSVTGHQYIFIGVSDFGIYKGEYNASLPGKIQWDPNAEFVIPPNTRVPAITDVNGAMYFGSTDQTSWISKIFRRVDGNIPSYNLVFTDTSMAGLDIRGFTAVKDLSGTGDDLWFFCSNYFRRLLPQHNDSIVNEMEVSPDLSNETGRDFSANITTAFNDHQPFWRDPETGDTAMFIGVEAMYDTTWLALNPYPNIQGRTIDGMYYTRKQSGSAITYQLHYIVNNTPAVIDTLLAVRTMCISPFASDSNKVLYSGGYHTNSTYLNNTAWVYKGIFSAVATSANNDDLSKALTVFPNPARQSFTIELPKGLSNLNIQDVAGRVIYENSRSTGKTIIDCRRFASGIYFIRVATDNQSYNQKLIIANK